MTLFKRFSFNFKTTKSENVRTPNFLRFSAKMCPAMLNILSGPADDACTPKYFLAKSAIVINGKNFLLGNILGTVLGRIPPKINDVF